MSDTVADACSVQSGNECNIRLNIRRIFHRKKSVVAKKAKIPDPLSEIATSLVAALEAHRTVQNQNPNTPFLTWSQLVATQPGVSSDWITAALQKAPAKGQILIAVSDDLKSPVALVADRERLTQDASVLQRLIHHPSTGSSEAIPVRPLVELSKSLDKNLRKPFEAYWTQNAARIPAGLLPIEKKAGKKTSLSIHDERFARPDAVLSQNLSAALDSMRQSGEAAYPALFIDLLAKADVSSDDPLLPAALALPPFAESAIVVAGKFPTAWLAQRSNYEQAVNTEGFFRRILTLQCSEAVPEVKLSVLAKVLSKELQPRFMEVWRTHADLHRKCSFAEFSPAGTKARPDLIIRDSRFPRPEKILAEQLVKVLEGQKKIGGSAYPSSLDRLMELTKTSDDKATRQRSTLQEPFAGKVVLAFPSASDSPAALVEDVELLAAASSLWEVALSQLTTSDNQAIAADKLVSVKGLNPLLRPAFASAIDRSLTEKQVPPGFAALRISSKWHLFRTRDMMAIGTVAATIEEPKAKPRKSQTSVAASPVSASDGPKVEMPTVDAQASAGFEKDFESAFERLSEVSRLPGCVSLLDLRPALSSYAKEVFDSELTRLRRSGQYSLSVVEGRYPLSDAERDACLVIENTAHLLVRRRA